MSETPHTGPPAGGTTRRIRQTVPSLATPKSESSLEVVAEHPAVSDEMRSLNIEQVKENLRAQKAETDWTTFREEAAKGILRFFYWVASGVLFFIFLLGVMPIGIHAFGLSPPGPPLVTEHVVLALIAGSVAQVGALAIAVGRGLFKERGSPLAKTEAR